MDKSSSADRRVVVRPMLEALPDGDGRATDSAPESQLRGRCAGSPASGQGRRLDVLIAEGWVLWGRHQAFSDQDTHAARLASARRAEEPSWAEVGRGRIGQRLSGAGTQHLRVVDQVVDQGTGKNPGFGAEIHRNWPCAGFAYHGSEPVRRG